MALPPGVGAVDFYSDLAIDCVETVNVTKACQVTSAMPYWSCLLRKRHVLPVKSGNALRQLEVLIMPLGLRPCALSPVLPSWCQRLSLAQLTLGSGLFTL